MAKYKTGGRFEQEGTESHIRAILNLNHVNTHDRQLVFRTALDILKDPVKAKEFTEALLKCPKMTKRVSVQNSDLH